MRRTLIVIGGVSSMLFVCGRRIKLSSKSTALKGKRPSDLPLCVLTTPNRTTRSLLCCPVESGRSPVTSFWIGSCGMDGSLSLIDHPPPGSMNVTIVRVIHIKYAEYTREIFRVPTYPGPYESQKYPRLSLKAL